MGNAWFEGDALVALGAYWDLFEEQYQSVADALREEGAGILHPADAPPALRGANPSLSGPVRQAMRDGDWGPVEASVAERAQQMARLGMSFDEWTDLVLLGERHLVPRIVAKYAADPTTLSDVLGAMHDFWRVALRSARPAYVEARRTLELEKSKALEQSEARSLRSERLFRAIVETSPDAVSLMDRDGKILYVSTAAAGLAGRGNANLVGVSIFDLVAPQDLEIYRKRWQECLDRPGIVLRHDFRTVFPDGSIHYRESLRVNHLGDPNIAAVLSVVRDVTEARTLEDQLRQSQKMEAIGTLAGGVAHDFNNLLVVILGQCEVLLSGLPGGDPTRVDLEQIREAGERAAALTTQLLAFSRKQVLEPRVIRLAATVEAMDRMVRRLIGEHIELVTATGDSVGHVLADPGQMEQVLLNLVVNARDAMPEGGTLWLATADVDVDAARAASLGVARGPHVMMSVQDSGTGMDAATVARIFEPFFTTKAKGGTGLGLSTVFGIVKQSGGAIAVESAPGKGTTFRVYLPRTSAVARVEEAPAPAMSTRGNERILLVEDADMVRRLTRKILESDGYVVLEASGPGEAVRIAEQADQGGQKVDLLLTDMVMPQMTGRELARRLAAERPAMKVLYMSGYTEDAITRDGVLEPGVAFLSKPFLPDDLLRKVRETLDGVR